MTRWKKGDKVRPIEKTDHPESEIGEVAMPDIQGGVLVYFPEVGGEIYHPDELMSADEDDELTE